jgi:hypothetical protein
MRLHLLKDIKVLLCPVSCPIGSRLHLVDAGLCSGDDLLLVPDLENAWFRDCGFRPFSEVGQLLKALLNRRW